MPLPKPKGALTVDGVFAGPPGSEAPVVKNLSLALAAGDVLGVIGPSGAGKSTLARVMIGIWPQVSGEVLLDERPLDGWSRTELVSAREVRAMLVSAELGAVPSSFSRVCVVRRCCIRWGSCRARRSGAGRWRSVRVCRRRFSGRWR